ncbi:hypothetical protein DRO47_04210 [Candidatus Bathyarchaeota archaeon]|nr:MAG: hypothetical protein DRO47_04210 [Candidatus Bathyarchaeota archaeon]
MRREVLIISLVGLIFAFASPVLGGWTWITDEDYDESVNVPDMWVWAWVGGYTDGTQLAPTTYHSWDHGITGDPPWTAEYDYDYYQEREYYPDGTFKVLAAGTKAWGHITGYTTEYIEAHARITP